MRVEALEREVAELKAQPDDGTYVLACLLKLDYLTVPQTAVETLAKRASCTLEKADEALKESAYTGVEPVLELLRRP